MYQFPRHSAGIFETVDEKFQLIKYFFLQGKAAGRQLGIFLHDIDQDTFLNQVSDSSLDLHQGLKEGWFISLPAEEGYLPDGHFDFRASQRRLGTLNESALTKGFTGLNLVGVMSWVPSAGLDAETLVKYEFGLADTFEKNPGLHALCLYSKSFFSLQDISVQCACHPHVVTVTDCQENPIGQIQQAKGFSESLKKQDLVEFWNQVSTLGAPLHLLRGSNAKSVLTVFSEARNALLLALEDEKNQSNPEIFKLIELLDHKMEQLGFYSALRETR